MQRVDAGRSASTSSHCCPLASSSAHRRPPHGRRSHAARAANRRSSRHVTQAAVLTQPATEADSSNFCGEHGVSMARPPPKAEVEGKQYHIHTFGCQMNLADSERMAGVLDAAGYRCADDANSADVVIYNTCSIRDKAEQKVYSALGRQAQRKRARGSDVRLVLAGCVAQQEGAALLRRVPELDLVMGPQHANQIGALLEQVDQGSQVVATEPVDLMEDVTVARRDSDVTAWVNVIHGCNERCTYCVVPNTRGTEQSRWPHHIKREMQALADAGYREVTLLGQNIDAYGRDLPGFAEDGSGRRAHTLTDLLHHIHDVEGIERIRFATSHPRYFTERLVKACAELPKMCQFFHIPFQSGDDEVLRRMRYFLPSINLVQLASSMASSTSTSDHSRRGYTAARYQRILDNIRRHMPDASISGDAIVGFPGETEEQFQATCRLVEECGFDRVNTAAYSPRPNTPAAVDPDQVADLVKADRLARLNRVCWDVAEQRAQRLADRTLQVLVEGPNPKNPNEAMGRTTHNKLTFFPAPQGAAQLKGQLVDVHITTVHAFSLFGDMVQR